MKENELKIPRKKIAEFCARWKVSEFALFGSALRGDFSESSDVDVLLTFSPDAGHTLFSMVRMKDELSDMFGREVDVVSRRGVESGRNPIRKKEILETAKAIYVA